MGSLPGERKDIAAIRRHWQLVMCAFIFCSVCSGGRARSPGRLRLPPVVVFKRDETLLPALSEEAGRGKKEGQTAFRSGGGAVVAYGVS